MIWIAVWIGEPYLAILSRIDPGHCDRVKVRSKGVVTRPPHLIRSNVPEPQIYRITPSQILLHFCKQGGVLNPLPGAVRGQELHSGSDLLEILVDQASMDPAFRAGAPIR